MCWVIHKWAKWYDVGHIEHYLQHKDTGKKIENGRQILQGRVCDQCGKKQIRRVRV